MAPAGYVPNAIVEARKRAMTVQVDLRVLELMASRLCHDLVGPVGAVNNGLELLEEELGEPGGMGDDALRLAMDSARRAAQGLQFYRFAFGMAGSRVGGDLGEVETLVRQFLGSERTELVWEVAGDLAVAPEDTGKVLLNMILIGKECLQGTGTLSSSVSAEDGGVALTVVAAGERASLRDDLRPALADDPAVEDLSPRTVHAYLAQLFARRLGATLACEAAAGRVRVSTVLPLG